jgi:hypothetical protein
MRMVGLSLVSGLAFSGCDNSTICGNAYNANQNVANSVANCAQADPGYFGGFSPCFDADACKIALMSCSVEDQKAFQDVIDCQNNFANNNDCSFAALQQEQNCAINAVDGGSVLSPTCEAAFVANPGTCGPDGG